MLRNIVVPCELNPLPAREVEVDEFQVHYTANEKPHIQNDTITINYRLAGVEVLLASSCAGSSAQATSLFFRSM